jgi:solute carrier family 50 protein (sugar transporter)
MSVLFLFVYILWANGQRRHVFKLLVAACAFNAATIAYAFGAPAFQSAYAINQTLGYIAIVCGLVLNASPFTTISTVVKTRSAVSIPITMVLAGVVSNGVWLVYSLLVSDMIIAIQGVINTILCAIQVSLYVVFRPGRAGKDFSATATDIGSLALTPSGSTEVELSFVQLDTPKTNDELALDRSSVPDMA